MLRLVYWATVAIELIGGLCLLLGFFTRFWAYVLAIFSVAAAIALHTKFSDPNQLFNFLKDVAIAGGLLQVAAFGTGDDLSTKTPRILARSLSPSGRALGQRFYLASRVRNPLQDARRYMGAAVNHLVGAKFGHHLLRALQLFAGVP